LGAVVAESLALREILTFMLPPALHPVIVTLLKVSVYGVLAVLPVVAVAKACAALKLGSSVVDEQPVAICMMTVWPAVVFPAWVK
jgi:hypothetical protein